MFPHSQTSYCIILMSIIIYTFLILRSIQERDGKVNDTLKKNLDKIRKESKYTDLFIKTYNYLLPKFIAVFRLIPIIFAINSALHSINLLNTLLFCMGLLFMWNPKLDPKYWVHFLIYIFFMIIIKQVSNLVFPIQKFNIEMIAMTGITTIEQKAMESSQSKQLQSLFMLSFFASFHQKFLIERRFNLKSDEQEQQTQLETESRLIASIGRVTEFIKDLYSYYMIWVYHICFNFILIFDHKDVLSTVLYATESITLMIHVVLWSKNSSRDYRKIYRVWYVNFIIVIFYAFIRYLMLYLKYSTVNFMMHSSPRIREIVYKFIARELLDKEMVLIDYSYIIRNYKAPLLLLAIGVLTRNSFK